MSKVYFWRDVRGDLSQFSPYTKQIQRLLAGEYKALNLERLQVDGSYRLYSIRVNDANRIIFTTYQGCIYLLDVVFNHDYHRCAYFNPQSIKRKLDGLVLPQLAIVDDKLVLEKDTEALLKSEIGFSDEKIDYLGVEWHQNKLVFWGVEQESAVVNTELPVVIHGPAGSGKSMVAISLMINYVRDHLGDETAFPLLLVSQSEKLMRELARALAEADVDSLCRERVHIKTYRTLFSERTGDQIDVATSTHYFDWYSEFTSKKENRLTLNAEVLWQEFRICSGYEEEVYCKLGKRHSGVDDSERKKIYAAYQMYLVYLRELHLKHPKSYPDEVVSLSLTALPAGESYPMVVVDEAQDLSFGQLQDCLQLSRGNIAFMVGGHQVLGDGKSRLPYLEHLLYQHNRRCNKKDVAAKIIELPFTYRNPPHITSVAKCLAELKVRVAGGTADKMESVDWRVAEGIFKENGQVHWYKTDEAAILSQLQDEARLPQLAIVTLAELKDKVKALFKTELVFTAEEIKGLQYPTIVMYKLFDNEHIKQANKKMKEVEKLESSRGIKVGALGRSKNEENDDFYRAPFNRLITAVTRASNKLIILQEITHHNEKILLPIHALILGFNNHTSLEKVEGDKVCSEMSWSDEVQKHLDVGDVDRAKAIWVNTLGRDENAFLSLTMHESAGHSSCLSEEIKLIDHDRSLTESSGLKYQPSQKDVKNAHFLIKNFSVENLNKAIESPFVFLRYLFDIPVTVAKKQYTCLMMYINDSKKHIEILFNYLLLQNESFISGLLVGDDYRSGDLLLSLSLLLVFQENKHLKSQENFLYNLFEKNPDLYQKMPPERWYYRAFDGVGDTQPVLYYICWGHHEMLLKLFHLNPELFFYFDTILCPESKTDASGLYMLIAGGRTEDFGGQFLFELIEKYPFFCNEAVVKRLNHLTRPLLCYLSQRDFGIKLLFKIVNEYPQLHQFFSFFSFLYRPDKGLRSAFDYLSQHEKGPFILETLLQKGSLSDVTAEILGHALCNKEHHDTPLGWLSLSSDGVKLTNLIFQRFSKLESYVHVDMLFVKSAYKKQEIMPIYQLAFQNCDILGRMVANNPIFTRSLLAQKSTVRKNIYSTLARSEQGCTVLKLFINLSFDLAKDIAVLVIEPPKDKYKNNSPLCFLCTSDFGLDVLHLLFDVVHFSFKKNESPFEAISIELLTFEPPIISTHVLSFNPLLWLSIFKKGIEFLKKIMDVNLNLAAHFYNTKSLYCLRLLELTSQGQELLKISWPQFYLKPLKRFITQRPYLPAPVNFIELGQEFSGDNLERCFNSSERNRLFFEIVVFSQGRVFLTLMEFISENPEALDCFVIMFLRLPKEQILSFLNYKSSLTGHTAWADFAANIYLTQILIHLFRYYSLIEIVDDASLSELISVPVFLHELILSSEKCLFLVELLHKSPLLCKKIDVHMIYNTHYIETRLHPLPPLFNNLVMSKNGCEALSMMFTHHDDFVTGLTNELLYLRDQVGNVSDTSPIYSLLGNSYGQKVLLKYFEKRPSLFQPITADEFIRPLATGYTVLHLLCTQADEVGLLGYYLEKQPSLYQDISLESLCVYIDGSNSFMLLTSSDAMCVHLKRFLLAQPNVDLLLLASQLGVSRTYNIAKNQIKMTPLQRICMLKEGASLINDLFMRYPDLMPHLSHDSQELVLKVFREFNHIKVDSKPSAAGMFSQSEVDGAAALLQLKEADKPKTLVMTPKP